MLCKSKCSIVLIIDAAFTLSIPRKTETISFKNEKRTAVETVRFE